MPITPRQRSDILAAAFRRIDVDRDLAPMESWVPGSWRDDAEIAPLAPSVDWVEISPELKINANFPWDRNRWIAPDDWA